jgi:hypothetical protein
MMGSKEVQQDELLRNLLCCIDGYVVGSFDVGLFTAKPTITIATIELGVEAYSIQAPDMLG